jgi:peptidoglycan/xylan/chitin deacetylase (PgdA/CDA1 family)
MGMVQAPVASLSLDLDNQWSYMKIHGDAGWERYPSYLDVVVPRAIDLLGSLGLRVTVFVVGQDAALAKNRASISALAEAGHEIGNHSFRHEPWLDRYSEPEMHDELGRAEDAIEDVTGVIPRGFRGPGYALSKTAVRVLIARGYEYDASTLPTVVGPLARAYYFRTARLTEAERAERSTLYGSWQDGLRPITPYRWTVGSHTLVELPVTTFPVLRLPIHMSYIVKLSSYSAAAAARYFDAAIRFCKAKSIGPSILLHPLDLISSTDVSGLDFFPGMSIPVLQKLEWVAAACERLARAFDVVPLGEHVARVARTNLPVRSADVLAGAAA